MNYYLLLFKEWYETRQIREKLLVLGFSFAFMYAIFSLLFLNALDVQARALQGDILEVKNQIVNWKKQIALLNEIPKSPLYNEWLQHRHSIKNLESQYKFFLKSSPTQQWQDIVKTILQSEENIKVAQIKNSPESQYNPLNLSNLSEQIYQQRMEVIVYSNYFDTVKYLTSLEQRLPNLHWDSLSYEVVQYPTAKVQMEFSIIYEKN